MDYSTYFLSKRNDGLHWKRNSGGNACGVDFISVCIWHGHCFYFHSTVYSKREKETAGTAKETLLLQFRDAMQSVAAALQAGYSMENAWRESEKEMTELYGQDGIFVGELHQINQAVGMNQPIEKLLYEFALRSDCEDIQNFSDVFCSRNAVAVIFTKL